MSSTFIEAASDPPGLLAIKTERFELRVPDDGDLGELADLAAKGIHKPGPSPFKGDWSQYPAEQLKHWFIDHHLGNRASMNTDSWHLSLGAWSEKTPMGCFEIHGEDMATSGTFSTTSWISPDFQGAGVSGECRAAVLNFAFYRLGAQRAVGEVKSFNQRQRELLRRMGYEEVGEFTDSVSSNEPYEVVSVELTKARWSTQLQSRRPIDVSAFAGVNSLSAPRAVRSVMRSQDPRFP